MEYNEIKEKAQYWLNEMKRRYNYKEYLPCDFLIEHLTVLDLIMIADDIEMLSEMLMVHGEQAIKPCICEALTYVPELDKNECYKTLRAVEGINIGDCIKIKQEEMKSMMSPLLDKNDEKDSENIKES